MCMALQGARGALRVCKATCIQEDNSQVMQYVLPIAKSMFDAGWM